VVFNDLFPKPVEELVSIGPHPGVLLFLLPAAAKFETNGREPPHQGSTDLPVSPQSASEGSQGPDHFVAASPQFLLPDRKNCLASMEPLQHELFRFFLHFFQRHGVLLFKWISGVGDGIPKKPTRIATFFKQAFLQTRTFALQE